MAGKYAGSRLRMNGLYIGKLYISGALSQIPDRISCNPDTCSHAQSHDDNTNTFFIIFSSEAATSSHKYTQSTKPLCCRIHPAMRTALYPAISDPLRLPQGSAGTKESRIFYSACFLMFFHHFYTFSNNVGIAPFSICSKI